MICDNNENFTAATLERSTREALTVASTGMVALKAASPHISKFLTKMLEPVLTNLVKNGKNKFMGRWMKKILPNTGLKGSRMAKQIYEDIEKGNPDLVIRMLNQKMEDWNM